jgi:hypothetical protein
MFLAAMRAIRERVECAAEGGSQVITAQISVDRDLTFANPALNKVDVHTTIIRPQGTGRRARTYITICF